MANLSDVSLVSIGAWNPAILQPGWLRKELPSLITDEIINIQFIAGVSAYKIEFTDFCIDPNGGRLVITPKKYDVETLIHISKIAQGIADKLKYTPVIAAGGNFTYKLESNEVFSFEDSMSHDYLKNLYQSFGNEYNVVTNGIHHTLSGERCSINISYDIQTTAKFIGLNFHYSGSDFNLYKYASEDFVDNFHKANDLIKTIVRII